jgi:hypothetical protein
LSSSLVMALGAAGFAWEAKARRWGREMFLERDVWRGGVEVGCVGVIDGGGR